MRLDRGGELRRRFDSDFLAALRQNRPPGRLFLHRRGARSFEQIKLLFTACPPARVSTIESLSTARAVALSCERGDGLLSGTNRPPRNCVMFVTRVMPAGQPVQRGARRCK
ncbi:MAG: hypothetical protein ABR915_19100 [Thermoguttaceae bacterium]